MMPAEPDSLLPARCWRENRASWCLCGLCVLDNSRSSSVFHVNPRTVESFGRMRVLRPSFNIYSAACSCPETAAHFPLGLGKFLTLEIIVYYWFFLMLWIIFFIFLFGGVDYLFRFNWNKVFNGDDLDVLIYAQHKQL